MDNSPQDHTDLSLTRSQMLLTGVGSQVAILLFGVLLGWLLSVPWTGAVQITPSAIIWGIVLTLPMAAFVIAIVETSRGPFGQLRADFGRVLQLFGNCTPLDLLILSLLAGVGEEILFRGVLQVYIAGWAGPFAALGVASILFGFAHAISRVYTVFAALIGLYLGALYLWFDNLLVPMIVHGLYDFIALIYGVHYRKFRIPPQ
jgi:membrane protease YdiL (CAAX protease family)